MFEGIVIGLAIFGASILLGMLLVFLGRQLL
jgi:hypothetical protein